MDVPRIYATAFRRLREWRGWTQEELSRRLGSNKSTVSKLETGKQVIDAALVERCLQAFGISLSTFHRFCEGVAQEERVLREEGAHGARPTPPGSPAAAGRDGDRLLILRQEAGEEVELEVYLKLR